MRLLKSNELDYNVIFRVDGNSTMGLGHLYRGMALAEIVSSKYNIVFLIQPDTIVEPLIDANFAFHFLPEDLPLFDEPNWISKNFLGSKIIVLDGYQFEESYQAKIKSLDKRLIYIDDLVQGTQKADVVINHNPNVKNGDYIKEDYTKLALGLEYAILRKTFADNIGKGLVRNAHIKTIFISFGGADPDDFTCRSILNVLQIEDIGTINVVLGAAYQHKKIFQIKNDKLRIYKNQSENKIFNLMKQSDIALVPASTTSIELASIGVPMILGYFTKNQISIYNSFVKNNAVFPIGDFKSYNFIKIKDLICTISLSNELNEKAELLKKMFKSYDRNKILNLFEKDLISLRHAEKSDVEFVFDLSNEPEVRQNSFNSNKIIFEDHIAWFENIITRKGLYYIIENNKRPIGQIRFEEKKDFSIIGISISNKFRGNGFAKKGLSLVIEDYFQNHSKPILAYIKKTNLSSINTFKRANFSFYKEDLIKGINSDVYIKRK